MKAPPSTGARTLRAQGLRKSFAGRAVLDGVDLAVVPGEVHVVLGPSGSGKTTLLRLLNMLEAPDEGMVLFGDDDVSLGMRGQISAPAQLKARLATTMVLQKPVVFRMSVRDNAAFGLRVRGVPRDEADRKAQAALERLGIGHLAPRRARRLSGGEQQRLAFARASVLDLEFLLLDEFTANLDPPNVLALERAAREFAHDRGGGVLLVTHDLFQARRLGDRVTMLVEGAIIESGTREEFFERPKDERTRRFISGDAPL